MSRRSSGTARSPQPAFLAGRSRHRRTVSAPGALAAVWVALALAVPVKAQALVPSGQVIKDVNPNAPAHQYREGQFGYNDCSPAPPAPATPNSAASKCQTAWIGGAERFCLFLPDGALTGNGQATISDPNAVAYCTMEGVGARDMPQGAISSVHFLMTSSYFQVTGRLNIAKLPGINPKDQGGQYDPITNGVGLPAGGVLFQQHGCGCALPYRAIALTSADPADIPYWTQLVHPSKANDGTWTYCLRACFGVAADRQALCPATFAKMGCEFVVPGDYSPGKYVYETGAPQAPYSAGATAPIAAPSKTVKTTVSGVGGPASAFSAIVTDGCSADGTNQPGQPAPAAGNGQPNPGGANDPNIPDPALGANASPSPVGGGTFQPPGGLPDPAGSSGLPNPGPQSSAPPLGQADGTGNGGAGRSHEIAIALLALPLALALLSLGALGVLLH